MFRIGGDCEVVRLRYCKIVGVITLLLVVLFVSLRPTTHLYLC